MSGFKMTSEGLEETSRLDLKPSATAEALITDVKQSTSRLITGSKHPHPPFLSQAIQLSGPLHQGPVN